MNEIHVLIVHNKVNLVRFLSHGGLSLHVGGNEDRLDLSTIDSIMFLCPVHLCTHGPE